MQKKKILIINGSLRKNSLNRQLAESAAAILGERAAVTMLDYANVPLMNPDIEFPVPEAVQEVRDAVKDADGVWIFFPEYNYSYPGVLKNLLDWISRPVAKGAPRTTAVTSGVPVTYCSVTGSSGGTKAFEKMYDLLKKIHMEIMTDHVFGISDPEVADGKMVLTEDMKKSLKDQAEAFLSFIERK